MSFVELETDIIGLNHPIDAPPGPFPPPPDEQTAAHTPTPPASKLEAVFSSRIVKSVHAPDYMATQAETIIPPELIEEFLLKSPLVYEELVIGEERTPGYAGSTNNNEDFFIGLSPHANHILPPMQAVYNLNGASKELTARQLPVESNDAHDKTLIFLAVNFNQIGRILADEEIPDDIQLNCWVELRLFDLVLADLLQDGQTLEDYWSSLPNCGIVDLVGQLPDGQFIINEVKAQNTYRPRTPEPGRARSTSSRHRTQAGKHTRGLQTILAEHNPDTPLPAISQFMSIYDESKRNPNIIKILPKRDSFLPFLADHSFTVFREESAA